LERAPVGEGLLGALWTPSDLRVDPREAAPAIAAWLAALPGVTVSWSTTALGVEPGRVATRRGDGGADGRVVAVVHDLDWLFPDLAEAARVRRCTLQMLRVAAEGPPIYPTLATGLALLRYRGFSECPSLPALRARLERERPELIEHEVNLL